MNKSASESEHVQVQLRPLYRGTVQDQHRPQGRRHVQPDQHRLILSRHVQVQLSPQTRCINAVH
jgi:hypothetical protein